MSFLSVLNKVKVGVAAGLKYAPKALAVVEGVAETALVANDVSSWKYKARADAVLNGVLLDVKDARKALLLFSVVK